MRHWTAGDRARLGRTAEVLARSRYQFAHLDLGPPARVDELPNGNRLYTYSKSSTYRQPTFVSPGYSTPSRTTVNVVGNTAYATTTPGTTVGTTVMGGNTYESYCNVFLTVDMATQRVSSSRYEGNSCRSVPPNQQR